MSANRAHLVLWRHAEAGVAVTDMQRALTERGQLQAQAVAAWLDQYLPNPRKIRVSPATRTQQTASALSTRYDTVEDLGPDLGFRRFVEAVDPLNLPLDGSVTVIVSHQPSIGHLAAGLLKDQPGLLAMQPATFVWMSFGQSDDGLTVRLEQTMTANQVMQQTSQT